MAIVNKSTPQTILLSAMGEFVRGADFVEAEAALAERFKNLSPSQVSRYVQLAQTRLYQGGLLSATASSGVETALPAVEGSADENRFAWFRLRGRSPTGADWTRDIHIGYEYGETYDDLLRRLDDVIDRIQQEAEAGRFDSDPPNDPGSPIGIELVGLL